jgi:hypothetical protein
MTQLERAKLKISELKPQLAFGDSAKIAKSLDLSLNTISNSVNGNVTNIDTLLRVYKEMKKIVGAREKELQS